MRRAADAYDAIGLTAVALYGIRPDGSCTCGNPQCGKSAGKHPRGAEWAIRAARRDRTDFDAGQIGLLTGDYSTALLEPDPLRVWIIAIDADGASHGVYVPGPKDPPEWSCYAGMTGVEVFETLQERHGKVDTWLQLTPSGGYHYVFRHPGGFIPTRSRVWPGVDVRGDRNGQIVVAPSVHPLGGQYVWEASSRPGEAPLADVPRWMLPFLLAPAPRAAEPTGKAAESFLGRCFKAAGMAGDAWSDRAMTVRCPWERSHTTGDDGARVLAPTNDDPMGRFYCHHGHCAGRSTADALRKLPAEAIATAGEQDNNGFEQACALLIRTAR